MANPFIVRFLVRSAYNIPGSACEDCLMTSFCTPCSINQMYQTTKAYGPPNSHSGSKFNVGSFTPQGNSFDCGKFCYACCCLPCAIGNSLESSVGLPCIFGCLCGNICLARNLTRYQYRLSGSDCVDDCFIPWMFMALSCCLVSTSIFCFPCAAAAYSYTAAIASQILNESTTRNSMVGRTTAAPYLSDEAVAVSSPNPIAGVVVMSSPPSGEPVMAYAVVTTQDQPMGMANVVTSQPENTKY